MFSSVMSAAICGIDGCKIVVEADVSDGLPVFSMVGYLASEVREAQDRVRTALKNAGIRLPAKRITVNLAPADVRKAGSGFDLPIAVAVLLCLEQVPAGAAEGTLFVGELGLDGRINGVRGVMELAACGVRQGCHTCVVPAENLAEGAAIQGIRVLGASHISQVIRYLRGQEALEEKNINIEEIRMGRGKNQSEDFSQIQGQALLRRAAEVAVSGLHNLLIIGPPGAGKTMTARRIPTILPELSWEEALEVSKIHSIAGTLPEDGALLSRRPFRAPHHTVTAAALAGGGRGPRPGEVSLAHRGILYLDELPEFEKGTLEILRQPMEEGRICITRNSGSYVFPADFMLVASMNPCKCGYYPDMNRCTCSQRDVQRYLDHVSAPLLDRIDIAVEAGTVNYEELTGTGQGECSAAIRERVKQAQQLQRNRYQGTKYRFNSDLDTAGVRRYCPLDPTGEKLMRDSFERLELTARSHCRILKVARTIADLEGSPGIETAHLGEAICYRSLDQKYWRKAR